MKKSKTTEEIIRSHIKKLHESGSGNYQTLLRQVNNAYKPIRLNIAQMHAIHTLKDPKVKELNLEWGRGTGKSTTLGGFINEFNQSMPRSHGQMIGETYKHIMTKTSPSIKAGLELFGIYQDLHYFVGRRPPRSWNFPKAYKMPDKMDHVWWFWTGTVMTMISQDVDGDGRGLNTDWEVKDEAALLDIEKINTYSSPALRGSKVDAFKNSHYFCNEVNCSSTPLTPKGMWFIEREEAAYREPEKIRFSRADWRVNIKHLTSDYEQRAKSKTLPLIFNAEYRNIRVPLGGTQMFYSGLNEKKHTYNSYDYSAVASGNAYDCRADTDRIDNKPLILGVDWGATINACVVNQITGKEHRLLKNFYALGADDKIQDDMFKEFHEYYQYHQCKDIFLWYDNTGNVKTGITKQTRAQLARKQLTQLGWNVHLMTLGGSNIDHEIKYVLWQIILKEDQMRFPRFRVNHSNAREAWISMSNAKYKQNERGVIQKDKSEEKKNNPKNRPYATDLSDAQDAVMLGMYRHLLKDHGALLPEIPS